MLGFDPSDSLAWLALADWLEEQGSDGTVCRPGLPMTYIPPGTFLMGSHGSEEGRSSDEGPQQWVTLAGFYLAVCPVTQAQWLAVMGSNPSHFKGDDRPVENVSWNDCQAFCTRLRQLTGQSFRLPTEAEWEYACRAGTTTAYHSGNGEEALKKAGWYSGNSSSQTQPVGQKAANAWGLFDMHGNVWEWCRDWYGSYSQRDRGAGSYRMLRGGCWHNFGGLCRSAYRYSSSPGTRNKFSGCRVAADTT